jgi:hypothetical protein
MNQRDAIFFTLFRYHASTCFGFIFSSSSRGQENNVAMAFDLLLRRLYAGLDEKEHSHPDPHTVALKANQLPLSHYSLGLLMMG